MNRENRISDTLAEGHGTHGAVCLAAGRTTLEDLDVEVSRAVAPDRRRFRRMFVNDLKLLFAALGAGGSVVPLGDNGRTTRLLSEYTAALRDH